MARTNQRTVTVHRRLRPLRLAFLVRPTDKVALRRIFQINTCLWGGRFNPIIPIFRRTPRWWSDLPRLSPSAREIAKGYLDAFEPDYVVAMSDGLGNGLGIPEKRLLTEKDVFDPAADDPIGHGVDVVELYKNLYRREFQFQRRYPREVVLPEVKDPGTELFGAACLGEFPSEESMKYLSQAYREAFDAKALTLDGPTLFTIFLTQNGYPLRMGSVGLEVHCREWVADPALFFMDATSPIDLIDYWNLRAVGWSVLPVPRQWADVLVDKCSAFVTKNYVPYRHNKDMMHGTMLLGSRSVPVNEVRVFANRLIAPGQGSLIPGRYPRMWDEWARDKDHVVRCDIVAEESDVEVSVVDSATSFRDISPNFAEPFSGRGAARWANVVQLREYSHTPESAPVIPAGLSDLGALLGGFPFDPFGDTWATREGIVLACDHVNANHRWVLPTGLDVFRAWMKEHSFSLDLSGPGRVALQVIRALSSTWGTLGMSFLAHEELIHLLGQMASGQVESEVEDEDSEGKRKKSRGKIISVGELLSRLEQINEKNKNRAKGHLDFLVQHKVIEVGLRLQCTVCGQHNWYSIQTIGDMITCERCLQQFSFPAAEPPVNAWYYRTVGPFSVENYAQGSYCVTLTLRFLGDVMRAQQTWVPSFTLKRAGHKDLEADLGILWRRSSVGEDEPWLILGECKTFGCFETKDVRRMRDLGKAFPGAVLAFCTLRKTLEPEEKKRIGALARAGRKYLRADLWRNPILVLTGIELFGELFGPPHCWKAQGGAFAKFAETYRGFGGLTELCDATQQLHLGIEPYWEWREKDLAKRRARRVRRVQKLGNVTSDVALDVNPEVRG